MNQNSGDDDRSEGKGGADAPLHEALDNLEDMLGPRGATTPGSKDAPPGVAPRTGPESDPAFELGFPPEGALEDPLAPVGGRRRSAGIPLSTRPPPNALPASSRSS